MRGGRRGEVGWLYETVITLIMLSLFAIVTYGYIDANATGDAFYSTFFAVDLATTAEVVNAAYGDVVLRYDNLKPGLDLGFWLANGAVAVAPIPEAILRTTDISLRRLSQRTEHTFEQPPDAITHRYGRAPEYPRPGTLLDPTFLAFRKEGRQFSILPADIADACPRVAPDVPLQDARVLISIDGGDAKTVREEFTAFQQGIPAVTRADAATITVKVTRRTGEDAVAFAPTGAAGRSFACRFARAVNVLTFKEFAFEIPGSASGFVLEVAVTGDVTDAQIGRALAIAFAEVYA